jgi:predicted metal-dependent peptidase
VLLTLYPFFYFYLQVFVASMHVCLEAADPNELSIERCLPGVNLRFDAAQHEARQMRTEIKDLKEEIVEVKGIIRRIATRDDMVEGLKVLLERWSDGKGLYTAGGGSKKRGQMDEDSSRAEEIDWAFTTRKPESVQEIYDEWKGLLGRFVGQPMEEGIEALEQSTNKRWRKRYKGADQNHFSRVVQLMSAIEGSTMNGRSLQEVIDELESLFAEKKKSLSALVVKLQHRGLIGKRVRN